MWRCSCRVLNDVESERIVRGIRTSIHPVFKAALEGGMD
jgi:hypothetical protein